MIIPVEEYLKSNLDISKLNTLSKKDSINQNKITLLIIK